MTNNRAGFVQGYDWFYEEIPLSGFRGFLKDVVRRFFTPKEVVARLVLNEKIFCKLAYYVVV